MTFDGSPHVTVLNGDTMSNRPSDAFDDLIPSLDGPGIRALARWTWTDELQQQRESVSELEIERRVAAMRLAPGRTQVYSIDTNGTWRPQPPRYRWPRLRAHLGKLVGQ